MSDSLRESEIDFGQELPRQDFFPTWQLARLWHCTAQHVVNLVESGELLIALDLRGKASSKSMIRVPRKAVVRFLNARKDLAAIAEANPRPAYRDASKRKARAA